MQKMIFGCCLICSFANADFYKNGMEGWFAYKDANITKVDENLTKEQVEKKPKKVIELPKDLNNLTHIEFEALMNESKGIASMNPTKHNLKQVIILQNFFHEKAGQMMDTWAEVMLEEPELDMSVNIAKTSFGRNAINLTSKEEKKEFFSKYSKYLTLVLIYDSNKRDITTSQDKVFDFISYTYPEIKQLKIDINNSKAESLFQKLKITKNITPDIWLMINIKEKQSWKRVAVGLSTQDKIMDKVYEYGNEIFNKGGKK